MDTANVMFVHFHFPRDAFPRGRRLSRPFLTKNKIGYLKLIIRKNLPRVIVDVPFPSVANRCQEVILAVRDAF